MVVPSLFTIGNMACGFSAILLAFSDEFVWAAALLGGSIALDIADGAVARLVGATSPFGVQLDSLADLVSFGLAPAVLVHTWALPENPVLAWLSAFLWLACAAFRLARFNVTVDPLADKKYFVGLPSPGATLVVIATILALRTPEAGPGMLVPVGVSVIPAALDGQLDPVPLLPRGALAADSTGARHHHPARRAAAGRAGARRRHDRARHGLRLPADGAPGSADRAGARAGLRRPGRRSPAAADAVGVPPRRRATTSSSVGTHAQRPLGARGLGHRTQPHRRRARRGGARCAVTPAGLVTRAHVVAHVALNGDALAGVLDAVLREEPVAMYESDERRDADIEELAGAGQADLLDRLLAATTRFADAVEAMDDEAWQGTFSRTPGTDPVPVATVPSMRRRELEVHHADLGVVYTRGDWPRDFLVELLDVVTVDHAASGPFTVRADDLDRSWAVGGGDGPTVAGPGADLGWWLTGRGDGDGLSCEAGDLPRLGPWRRASATVVPTPER